jgi:hypothetical protein
MDRVGAGVPPAPAERSSANVWDRGRLALCGSLESAARFNASPFVFEARNRVSNVIHFLRDSGARLLHWIHRPEDFYFDFWPLLWVTIFILSMWGVFRGKKWIRAFAGVVAFVSFMALLLRPIAN